MLNDQFWLNDNEQNRKITLGRAVYELWLYASLFWLRLSSFHVQDLHAHMIKNESKTEWFAEGPESTEKHGGAYLVSKHMISFMPV